jgi:hypothetical protein
MKHPPDEPRPNPRQEDSGPAADRPDRTEEGRRQHGQAFEQREKLPGEAGLANEARPGLGTRAAEEAPGEAPKPEKTDTEGEPRAVKAAKHHQAPRPEPQEQDPASLEQEIQRSTGVSGHMGGS